MMVKGQVFQFTALPFGMALSPWIFTKLMNVIASHMCQRAIPVVLYLFDWLIRDLIRKRLISHTKYCLQTVQSFDTSPEIYIYRDGISDTTEYSEGTRGWSRIPTSDYQSFSFPISSFGTNFPFSYGQTQCSSRFSSPRQTTLTSASDVSFVCLETTHSPNRSLHFDKQHDLIPFKMVDQYQLICFGNIHSSSGT